MSTVNKDYKGDFETFWAVFTLSYEKLELNAGTTNPGETRKPDNPLKGFHNIVQKKNPEPVAKRVNHINLEYT